MERQRLDVLLSNGIHWLFLGLFFFLPLLFFRQSSEVFELPKMLFVYAMTVAIVSLWLGRMIVKKQLLIHKTPLDIPILLFLLSQVVSTIYSIDPRTSWFGYYGRFHGGLISTISYTLLYYAFVSNYNSPLLLPVIGSRFSVFSFKSIGYRSAGFQPMNRKPTDQNPTTDNGKLITVILSSATLVSLYAILQHFGIDKNLWVQDVVNRVFSTQGQPNWLAAYLVMVIPLGWAGIVNREQRTENKHALTAYCLLFFALLFTKSRSGLIGFAVMDVVFWGLLIFIKPKKKYRLTTIVSNLNSLTKPFVLIHVLMVGLILATNNPAREWMLGGLQVTGYRLQETTIPALEGGITLRKSEHGGTESGDIRRLVWSGAIKLVKQRPLFGTGPETFAYTYWWVRPVEHNLTSEWNFLYNKAHNEWLNLAANTGLFGLGSHLLLLAWFSAWSFYKLYKIRNPKSEIRKVSSFEFRVSNLTIAAILAAIVGVEAVNFFGFSTVTVGAYTYLFMGLAVTAGNKEQEARNNEKQGKLSLFPVPCFLLLIAAALYLLSQVSISFLADLSFARGRAYLENRYAFQALHPLEIAAGLVPDEPVFRSSLAEDEGLLAMSLKATGEQPDLAEKLKDESLSNFDIVEKENPYSLSFLKTASRIVYSLGVFDPTLFERGITLSEKAAKLAPTNPSIPYTLGVMSEEMGKNGDAKEFYQQALELKPDYTEAHEKLKTIPPGFRLQENP